MAEIDIEFAPMQESTVRWVDELLKACKMFGIDYYNANLIERSFAEAVARKNYELKYGVNGAENQAAAPFLGIKRASNAS